MQSADAPLMKFFNERRVHTILKGVVSTAEGHRLGNRFYDAWRRSRSGGDLVALCGNRRISGSE